MRGIIFTESNFHLTVQGIKKQTRRIINPQPTFFSKPDEGIFHDLGYYLDSLGIALKPRYKVGETVYLKEPYSWISLGSREPVTVYKYDNEEHEDECGCSFLTSDWKNKMFMPESEARHFIKITDVRVERLQDISDADCESEGIFLDYIETDYFHYYDPEGRYYCADCEEKGRERLIKEALLHREDFGFDGLDDEWIKEELDGYSADDYSDQYKGCDICGKVLSAYRYTDGGEIFGCAVDAYAAMIDSINGKGTWKNNPFVFVYDYELLTE